MSIYNRGHAVLLRIVHLPLQFDEHDYSISVCFRVYNKLSTMLTLGMEWMNDTNTTINWIRIALSVYNADRWLVEI